MKKVLKLVLDALLVIAILVLGLKEERLWSLLDICSQIIKVIKVTLVVIRVIKVIK